MNIFLSNTIISDLQYDDYEIATYVALKSLYTSSREEQFMSYNMIACELFGDKCNQNSLGYIKTAFHSLVEKGLVSIVKEISTTEFFVNLSKLYVEFSKESNEYFTVIYLDEVRSIMNIDNRMDKFKLLRYYITCLRTICKSQGVYENQDIKANFVGFMSQEYLCEQAGINYHSNNKLIQQYNAVLEENKLLFVYRHSELKRNTATGQIKSFSNHYGRYADKEYIIEFAVNYEKTCSVDEKIVQSEQANHKRKLSQMYNNLCYDFDRYSKEYSSEQLIEIYEYIHSKNDVILDELIATKPNTTYYDMLSEKMKDEDIFKGIDCVAEYMKSKDKQTA